MNMTINLALMGVIHCGIKKTSEAPKYYTESDETGSLEIFPQYLQALNGREEGQILVVLFWLHEAKRDVLKVYPRGDKSLGLRGVFATRSPVRPNPIALSELQVLRLQTNIIEVSGVDVIDETPVVYIKSNIVTVKEKEKMMEVKAVEVKLLCC